MSDLPLPTALRTPLVTALESLATDVAMGEFGDPHVGLVILLSPDAAPSVSAISDRGITPFSRVTLRHKKGARSDPRPPGGPGDRFFTPEDLGEAVMSLSDAVAEMVAQRSRTEDDGRTLDDAVREGWEGRRWKLS